MASRIDGVDVTLKALKSVNRSLKGAVPVAAMASTLRQAIREKLQEEGHGRTYRTKKSWPGAKRYYTASTLGHPPASPTGNLRRAVSSRLNPDKTAATVGVHGSRGVAALAQILEDGRNPRVAARPFVIPTFEHEKPRLERLAVRRAERAVLKAQQLLDGSGKQA